MELNKLYLKLISFLAALAPLLVYGKTGRPDVVAGTANYKQSGQEEVVQVSDKAILEYKKFHIEAKEVVRFQQPSSTSTLLCRVRGTEASQIKGMLTANGKLLLINPNGIIFSKTARVHVGSLIASALDMKNEDFLNEKFRFQLQEKTHHASIINEGNIEALHDVVLMAPHLRDEGMISAKLGKIAYLGGEIITLNFEGDSLVSFAIETPLKQSSITLGGAPQAQTVYLGLNTAEQLIKNVVNLEGMTEANQIEVKDGIIRLVSSAKIIAHRLEAQSPSIQVESSFATVNETYLNATQEVCWKSQEKAQNVNIKTSILSVKTPLEAEQLNLQVETGTLLEHYITSDRGEFLFKGPVYLKMPELAVQNLLGEKISFEGPMVGTSRLSINAPQAKVILKADLGTAYERVDELHVLAREIHQYEKVYSNRDVQYKAQKLFLGNDISNLASRIVLDAPVTLFNQSSIRLSTGRYEGDVIFYSTLDSDHTPRTLIIRNERGTTDFVGDIGVLNPLADLQLHSDNIILRANIGADQPGVLGLLHLKRADVICYGNRYHAREQLWDVKTIQGLGSGVLRFETERSPLRFGDRAYLQLSTYHALQMHTKGADLYMPPVRVSQPQSIEIHAEGAKAYLKEIGKKASVIDVNASDIFIAGHIQGAEIKLDSDYRLEYAQPRLGSIIKTTLRSTGMITLNSKYDGIGVKPYPIRVLTGKPCMIGAQKTVYLEGKCQDHFPHSIPSNPPPKIYFRGYAYGAEKPYNFFEESKNHKSLTPALKHPIPYFFIETPNTEPRNAPMYYEVIP